MIWILETSKSLVPTLLNIQLFPLQVLAAGFSLISFIDWLPTSALLFWLQQQSTVSISGGEAERRGTAEIWALDHRVQETAKPNLALASTSRLYSFAQTLYSVYFGTQTPDSHRYDLPSLKNIYIYIYTNVDAVGTPSKSTIYKHLLSKGVSSFSFTVHM